ncbi:hypothetical protein Cgig2_012788 [Carnegiea gigantea]|uniref:FAS1 domain-containing protein n=1 Tax=Carnegiea gigantea TaxID=171969 RepID=A0A9Q1QFL3_9CARY|nr:hypothetical protein Cgig2_012788 [Carnegiea gigantea]
MATHLQFLSLFLLLSTATIAAVSTTNTTTILGSTPNSLPPTATFPSPFSLLPPPPFSLLLPQSPPQQAQFNTIIDALLSAGDFRNWANLLDPSILPFSATLFVPDDDAFIAAVDSGVPLNFVDPLLFPYHVVPLRIPFSALRLFPTGSRLPTLLPGFSLLVTNNFAANFTVNGARLCRPDLFLNPLFAVHGVGAVLDYALFGTDFPPPPPPPPPSPIMPEDDTEEVAVDEYLEIPAVYEFPNGAVSSCSAGFWVEVRRDEGRGGRIRWGQDKRNKCLKGTLTIQEHNL